MDKTNIRQAVTAKLRDIDVSELHAKGDYICQQLIAAIDWSMFRRISCYQSKEQLQEVDTTLLIKQLRSDFNVEVDETPNKYSAALPDEKYDAIIVPLIAFDDNCNRLGRGGGWYDRFLAAQPQAYKIGLAYELQHLKIIPHEPHDIALDAIYTEKAIISKK
jgi:5-formyltetrahydrofolate cyclo-ligase